MANPKTHILVIRLSAMGDCAMTIPVLQRLIKSYPKVQLTVLTKPAFAPIFKTLSGVTVLTADTKGKHKGFLGVIKLGLQLKKKKFTAVADLHNVLRSKIIHSVFFFSTTQWVTINKGRREKKALTRTRNKVFTSLKTTVNRYAEVFKELGFPVDLAMSLPTQKPDISEELHQFVGFSAQKWIGIAPLAAHTSKAYPLDLMQKIIADLNETNRYKLLFFGGGKKEVTLLKQWAEHFKNGVCVAGAFPLEKELQLIANLDVMVSMDSGNGHLAAMYAVPVITLWGSTHPYAGFVPFNQPKENQFVPDREKYPLLPTSVYGKTTLEGYEEAMRSISYETVLARIQTILEEKP